MPKRSSKSPCREDANELARQALDAVAPDAEPAKNEVFTHRAQPDLPEQPGKNPAAVALGRLGGLKGGKARAAKLSAAKRKAIAKKAATMRWADHAATGSAKPRRDGRSSEK